MVSCRITLTHYKAVQRKTGLLFWQWRGKLRGAAGGNGYQSIPANGIYSLFLLYRIPVPNTEGRAGTGGNIAGNNEAPGEWLRFRFGSDTYLDDTIFLNHGGNPSPVLLKTTPLTLIHPGGGTRIFISA